MTAKLVGIHSGRILSVGFTQGYYMAIWGQTAPFRSMTAFWQTTRSFEIEIDGGVPLAPDKRFLLRLIPASPAQRRTRPAAQLTPAKSAWAGNL